MPSSSSASSPTCTSSTPSFSSSSSSWSSCRHLSLPLLSFLGAGHGSKPTKSEHSLKIESYLVFVIDYNDNELYDQERVLWADGEEGETPLQQHWPSGRFSKIDFSSYGEIMRIGIHCWIFRAIFFTKAKDVVLWVNHSDHLVIR